MNHPNSDNDARGSGNGGYGDSSEPIGSRPVLSPIHRASRQIGVCLGEEMTRLGLGSGEGHLVLYLGRYAPVTIAELHRVFGLKRSTLTSILDRLEQRSVVRREVCPDDRRSFLIHLTDKGGRLAARVQRPVAELEAAVSGDLTAADLAGFRRVMAAIDRATRVEIRPADNGNRSSTSETPERSKEVS